MADGLGLGISRFHFRHLIALIIALLMILFGIRIF